MPMPMTVSGWPRKEWERGGKNLMVLITRHNTIFYRLVHLTGQVVLPAPGTSSWPVISAGRSGGGLWRKQGAVRLADPEIRLFEVWVSPKNLASTFWRRVGKRLETAVRECDGWILLALRILEDPSHFKIGLAVHEIWNVEIWARVGSLRWPVARKPSRNRTFRLVRNHRR